MKRESAEAVADYAKRRREAARVLLELSAIAFTAERVFRGLQRCSPHSWLRPSTDAYILFWVVAAALFGTISWCQFPPTAGPVSWLLIGAACLRVTDITQTVVNLALFDRLGDPKTSPAQPQEVHDVLRSVVLLLWNFFELIIWFGLAYMPVRFAQGTGSFWSRFYFSAVTQLTIGYGDLTPLGWGKALAVVQGILGWVLTVVVVARFVTALPQIREARARE